MSTKNEKIKQVLVIRKDLNMRRGKSVAQGAHASHKFLTENILGIKTITDSDGLEHTILTVCLKMKAKEIEGWLKESKYAKICVTVDSLEELQEIDRKAREAYIPSYVVLDSGLTEFKEPTITAVAVGPASSEKIDAITGNLKLW